MPLPSMKPFAFRTRRTLLAGAAAVVLALAGGCTTPGRDGAMLPLSSARIAELLANPERSAADRLTDERRKPQQMLEFISVRPGIVALDLSAGGGYTTELIARAVGPTGRVYAQSAPRTARPPPPQSESGSMSVAPPVASSTDPMMPPAALTARAARLQVGHIVPVVRTFEQPVPTEVANDGLDLVTLMFNYHDLGHLGVDRDAMNRAVFAALKPGGTWVIADHSGRPGTGISESGTLHRIDQTFLQAEVERAGFKLVQEGNFLRNPADPRDRNVPQPLQPKDEFVLKFIKP
jgi:predicted methyltransferase